MTIQIRSGGQTGADRAALDAAIAAGIGVGGWCPAGRWAEDGTIPGRYPLRETLDADPAVRTRRNVRDSDATLILSPLPLGGGTALTRTVADRLGRPVLVVDPSHPGAVPDAARWCRALVPEGRALDLNVAGPRESEAPGIYAQSRRFLTDLFARLGVG